jgi:hypothetical protein
MGGPDFVSEVNVGLSNSDFSKPFCKSLNAEEFCFGIFASARRNVTVDIFRAGGVLFPHGNFVAVGVEND